MMNEGGGYCLAPRSGERQPQARQRGARRCKFQRKRRDESGPRSLTLSPLRGVRANSSGDEHAADHSSAAHLIGLVWLSCLSPDSSSRRCFAELEPARGVRGSSFGGVGARSGRSSGRMPARGRAASGPRIDRSARRHRPRGAASAERGTPDPGSRRPTNRRSRRIGRGPRYGDGAAAVGSLPSLSASSMGGRSSRFGTSVISMRRFLAMFSPVSLGATGDWSA